MKVGDLVLCKYDDLKGIVVSPPFKNTSNAPSWAHEMIWVYTTCAPHLEHVGAVYPWYAQQLEVISESR